MDSPKQSSDVALRAVRNSPEQPVVSVIFVNYNGRRCTREAVLSVLRYSPGSEIIVVDNCSTDGSVEAFKKEFSSLIVLPLDSNRGFGFGCNRGAEAAKGRYLFFLNNDALLSEDTPTILASFLEEHPTVAACGPRLLNPDNSFQLSLGLDPGIVDEWTMRSWQKHLRMNTPGFALQLEERFAGAKVDWVSGAALMIRRDVFRRLEGFDESFFMYFEDADLCRQIRGLGYDVAFVNATSVVHLLGQSAKDRKSVVALEYRKSQLRYYQKHLSPFSVLLLRFYLFLRRLLSGDKGNS
jgi:GT2 family glycosyltransferase